MPSDAPQCDVAPCPLLTCQMEHHLLAVAFKQGGTRADRDERETIEGLAGDQSAVVHEGTRLAVPHYHGSELMPSCEYLGRIQSFLLSSGGAIGPGGRQGEWVAQRLQRSRGA